jgi:hypothetical protein
MAPESKQQVLRKERRTPDAHNVDHPEAVIYK